MKKKFIMSYSCGKDSTLALYRMIKSGHTPLALLVTVDSKRNRSWFHGIPEDLLKEVSKSLDIPLLIVKSEGDNYEETFEIALKEAKKLGADSCVFGDIDLEPHRTWCEDRCKNTNLESIFPLWQEGREDLTYEFIDSGFKTIVKNVRLNVLGEEFLGEILTRDLVKRIKDKGSDPCGENGEYHTFVYDGPIFNSKIEFKENGNLLTKDYGFLDIK
ncbi:MAG: diphthine--ammonia ligase [Clostridium sp.]|uniref:Dph6-related ATP pyrophosphatase n=1 Tax=Clostridium TaxID=1485 RepID=UPI002153284A|nr:diphthine--ammonia ligase [Clostridium sp. LY3-2]MCR6514085.1 diphthine--ammonia ligase [Clostridium sp. LY3-2]